MTHKKFTAEITNAIVISMTIIFGMLCSNVAGDEPCEQFLDALRDNGYYDIALDYLSEMESSSLAPDSFKQKIPFERAQTLIQSVQRIRDAEKLEQRLNEADRLLTGFESSADTPELKARAQSYRGDVQLLRAKRLLKLAENDRLTANEKSTHLADARKFLKQSLDSFGRAKDSYQQILESYQLDVRDPESKRRLKRIRTTYTVIRVKLPQILEMTADTLEPNDPQRMAYLEEAAREFEKLWTNYRKFRAGLDSCLHAARCYSKLGKPKEALSFLQQILSLPKTSSALPRQRSAMVLAADCWSSIEPYPFDDVIANLEPFCARLTRRDQRNEEWQRIQMELARAYYKKSEGLKQVDPSDGRAKNFNRNAAKLIKAIARTPGIYRTQAQKLMAEWNLRIDSEVPTVESVSMKTFAVAKQRAADLILEIESIHADTANLNGQLAVTPPNERSAIQSQLDDSQGRLESLTKNCFDALDRATMLAGPETSPEDLNQIRYLRCVCFYFLKDYFEAALIGEFLVDKYQSVAYSRQAGGIAVRSYAAMHDQATPDNRAFERSQLTDLSEKIVETWPGSNEATSAASTLVKLILSQPEVADDKIKTAMNLVDTIPESSLERAAMEVQLGTKLWFSHRRISSLENADVDELALKLDRAIEYLTSGLEKFNSGNLRMDAAWGALFLTNAYLLSDNLDAALKQLETDSVAPIDLVKQKNPIVFRSGKVDLYVAETYKTAGRVYLAAINKFPTDSQWIEKASAVVNAMKSRAEKSGDTKAKKDVLNLYRLIAVQLEKQLALMDDLEQQKRFSRNLKRFLDQLQDESQDANTIIWTGQTLMTLGDLFRSKSMEEEARPLYQSAVSALDRASKLGIEDEKLLNELKRLRAVAKGGMGKYDDSLKDFVGLLKISPNAWQVQMDAARTLQNWGNTTKTSAPLAKALGGTEKFADPKTKRRKNLIWGWSKLANAFKSNPKFKDAYYQSLLGAVETRFQYGMIENNQKAIAAALKRLNIAKTKDSQLGGSDWKPRFDKLENQIRQQLNSKN